MEGSQDGEQTSQTARLQSRGTGRLSIGQESEAESAKRTQLDQVIEANWKVQQEKMTQPQKVWASNGRQIGPVECASDLSNGCQKELGSA